MALIFDIENEQSLSLDDYLEFVQKTVDPRDIESLAESAHALRALANNRTFVLDAYHAALRRYWENDRSNEYQPQSFSLGQSTDFFVRANIWLPIDQSQRTAQFQKRLYAYDLAHDHNFNFLTVGYFGEGYETDIYEYSDGNCVGYMDEIVDLEFLGRFKLHPGRIMLYRAGRDIHVQYPPPSVSLSLNLMGRNLELDKHQQYIFDVSSRRLVGGAGDLVSNRLFLLEAAKYIYNDETADILSDFLRYSSCRKTKALALQVLETSFPARWEREVGFAAKDVREMSRRQLISGNYARSYSHA